MHIVLLVLMSLAVTTPVQPTSIYSASFPAEVELFQEAGHLTPNGRFAGVGMMNFSPTPNRIDFKGLQTIIVTTEPAACW